MRVVFPLPDQPAKAMNFIKVYHLSAEIEVPQLSTLRKCRSEDRREKFNGAVHH